MDHEMLDGLTKEDRILILSPHLDDAVLSAGGLMDWAVKRGIDVVAATIFTADMHLDGEPSHLVRELHAWWGRGDNPYQMRRREDIAAVGCLGARYIHGGLLDSIYRRDSDGLPLYETRQAVFSTPSDRDSVLSPLKALLSQWLETVRPTVVFSPMAVGRHLDHVITTETFRTSRVSSDIDIYLYEDIPYSAGFFPPDYPDDVPSAIRRTSWKIGGHVDLAVDFERKFEAIMKYDSQIAEIFPGRDAEKELRQYMRAASGEGFRERFWQVERGTD